MERSRRDRKVEARRSERSEGEVEGERLLGNRRMWLAYGRVFKENGRSISREHDVSFVVNE